MCAFLDKLGELRSLTPLAAQTCRQMNTLYGLDESQNFEVCSFTYWGSGGAGRGQSVRLFGVFADTVSASMPLWY